MRKFAPVVVFIFTWIAISCLAGAEEQRVAQIELNGRKIYFDARKSPCIVDENSFLEKDENVFCRNYPSYADALKAAKESGLLNGRKIIPSFGIVELKALEFDKNWINDYYSFLHKGYKEDFWGEIKVLQGLIDNVISIGAKFDPKLKDNYENTLVLLGAAMISIDDKGLPENYPAELLDKARAAAANLPDKGLDGISLDMRDDKSLGSVLVIGLAVAESEQINRQLKKLVRMKKLITGEENTTNFINVFGTLRYFAGKHNRGKYYSCEQDVAYFRKILEENDFDYSLLVDKKDKEDKLLPINFRMMPKKKTFSEWLFESPGVDTEGEKKNYMDVLISGLSRGKISFMPNENSGYYSYWMFARESLIRIAVGADDVRVKAESWYRWRKIKNFESIMAQSREMRIPAFKALNQREIKDTDVNVPLGPALRLEPLPPYYLRCARSYAYLQNQIESQIEPGKDRSQDKADAKRACELLDRLNDMRLWCYGLYLISVEDIGKDTNLRERELFDDEIKRAKFLAEKWLKNFDKDPVLNTDLRSIVPAKLDKAVPEEDVFWVRAGVTFFELAADFDEDPKVVVMDDMPLPKVQFIFKQSCYIMPTIEFFTITRPKKLPAIDEKQLKKMTEDFPTTEELKEELQGETEEDED